MLGYSQDPLSVTIRSALKESEKLLDIRRTETCPVELYLHTYLDVVSVGAYVNAHVAWTVQYFHPPALKPEGFGYVKHESLSEATARLGSGDEERRGGQGDAGFGFLRLLGEAVGRIVLKEGVGAHIGNMSTGSGARAASQVAPFRRIH